MILGDPLIDDICGSELAATGDILVLVGARVQD